MDGSGAYAPATATTYVVARGSTAAAAGATGLGSAVGGLDAAMGVLTPCIIVVPIFTTAPPASSFTTAPPASSSFFHHRVAATGHRPHPRPCDQIWPWLSFCGLVGHRC
ncbi:hypothetical protein GUJ93_ZPchr0001g29734 [Zizania palustris]|uniref:Uncharacterized protein n=1 Tax=Zizania palustris TaxID=103762 RepID=A0A8J5RNF3_ZIZPA|nr:hypothetical protein GUJ93_ZPchr0001g29734 [Zizania palustris]